MERYVDGFLIPVPKSNMEMYKEMAEKAGQVWKEHGALEYYECMGDDLDQAEMVSFKKAAGASEEETVMFSWIIYESREHRDKVNAAVMNDPRMKEMMEASAQPFASVWRTAALRRWSGCRLGRGKIGASAPLALMAKAWVGFPPTGQIKAHPEHPCDAPGVFATFICMNDAIPRLTSCQERGTGCRAYLWLTLLSMHRFAHEIGNRRATAPRHLVQSPFFRLADPHRYDIEANLFFLLHHAPLLSLMP